MNSAEQKTQRGLREFFVFHIFWNTWMYLKWVYIFIHFTDFNDIEMNILNFSDTFSNF